MATGSSSTPARSSAGNGPILLGARVDALVALFRRVEAVRMRGIPWLNRRLTVAAVGFEPVAQAERVDGAGHAEPADPAAVGVLVTPWFMNLVWLPLLPDERSDQVGTKVPRRVGNECFEFIRAHEKDFGGYEACSLYSPMLEFADQGGAVATAQAVLAALRAPAAVPEPALAPMSVQALPPGRRAFLLGRRNASA